MVCVNPKICNGCGACVEVCPTSALSLQHNRAVIDLNVCQGCTVCVDACPQGAIRTIKAMPIEPSIIDLIPDHATEFSVVPDQPCSISWRDAVVSTLVWTGREIAPRLANLIVNYLEQRLQSAQTNQKHQNFLVSGWFSGTQNSAGRQRRQRRHQRQFW